MLDWLPAPEDVVIDGADHNLAVTHPARIAGAIADFISRYPIE
jgi:pimeloyl-ACP methyl ester carboxylesterase